MDTNSVRCCKPRKWSMAFGWLQAIFFGLIVLILIACVFAASLKAAVDQELSNKREVSSPEASPAQASVNNFIGIRDPSQSSSSEILGGIVGATLFIAPFVILGIVSSIILITGVSMGNAEMLRAWLVIQSIFLGLTILMLGGSIANGLFRNGYSICGDGILVFMIIILVFAMWIVNVHRRELVAMK